MNKFAAIVLSAGAGKRMNSDVPKQYMDLDGKPVIYYSLMAFEKSKVDEIVFVVAKGDLDYCRKEIVEKYGFKKVTKIVEGGAERYNSVYEGINATEAQYLLIHDGARPMLTEELIERSMECVEKEGACVVAMPVKDTIKVADAKGFVESTPERNRLWTIQTPQSFDAKILKDAYQVIYADQKQGKEVPGITDDAMIVEYATRRKVKLVEGSYMNIKVTTPEDLEVAKIFLKKLKLLVDTSMYK